MQKIYVCERGYKYEGGSAFLATTSYQKAWRAVRDERLKDELDKNSDMNKRRYFNATHKNHWENYFDYYAIRIFEE